jgi:hypothetical protein
MAELPYIEDRTEQLLKTADGCDYELKKAVTAWVFHHLLAHARDGGSYRGLIYERLGFGPETYADLFDGLALSNIFHDARSLDAVRTEVARQQLTSLKDPLYLCDVSGCFAVAVASGEMRRTCTEHNHLIS